MSFTLPAYRAPDFTALGLEDAPEVRLVPVERDGVAPAGYHATTLFPEYFRLNGRWVLAEESRMDCVAVCRAGAVSIVEFRGLKRVTPLSGSRPRLRAGSRFPIAARGNKI